MLSAEFLNGCNTYMMPEGEKRGSLEGNISQEYLSVINLPNRPTSSVFREQSEKMDLVYSFLMKIKEQ